MAQIEISIKKIIDGFTARQQEALRATYTHRYVLYGGARGGGKSRFLRWWLLLFLLDKFVNDGLQNVTVGLFCNTYRELQDRQLAKIKSEFPPQIGEVKITSSHGLAFYLNKRLGGGIIALRNLDDPTKYQSAEFAAIAVDELTSITKDKFDILRGSLRYPNISHTVFVGATNPGNIGHYWVKSLWIDKKFPKEMEDLKDEFIFIQSLPADNPNLDKKYWEDLNSLPDRLRRAWVNGEWDVFSGQAFPTFDPAIHVVEPFEIPANWHKWRAVDWGMSAPFCCLWFAKDPAMNRIYVYRELYKTGLTDRQQAQMIIDSTVENEFMVTYADPSMWARKSLEEYVSCSADEYAAVGVPLTKGDNDRINGKRKVDRALALLPDGRPGLVIFNHCGNLIRTMGLLIYDEKNPEDVCGDMEDHAYDALRYGLTMYHSYVEDRRKSDGYRNHPLARLAWV